MSQPSYSPYYTNPYRQRHPSGAGGGSAVPAGAQPPPTPPESKGPSLSPSAVPPPRPHTTTPQAYNYAPPPPPPYSPYGPRNYRHPYPPPTASYPYAYDPVYQPHASSYEHASPPLTNSEAVAQAASTIPWIASQLPDFDRWGIPPEERDKIISQVVHTILSEQQQQNSHYPYRYPHESPGRDEEEDKESERSGSGPVAIGGGSAPPIMPGGFSSSPTHELSPLASDGLLGQPQKQLPALGPPSPQPAATAPPPSTPSATPIPPVPTLNIPLAPTAPIQPTLQATPGRPADKGMPPPKKPPAKTLKTPEAAKTVGKTKPKVEAGGKSTPHSSSIHDQVWGGYLFEEKPGEAPTAKPKLQSLFKGIANHMIKNMEPKDSIAIPPEKMIRLYQDFKVEQELQNWTTFFTSFRPANLSELYQALGCHHFLIPPIPSTPSPICSDAPTIPALTQSGFERWMTIQLLAYPDRESERLRSICMKLPIHDNDKNERFPKVLPRGCLPSKADTHMEQLWDDSVMNVKRGGYLEQGESVEFVHNERKRRPYASKSNAPSDAEDNDNFIPSSFTRKRTDLPYASTHVPFDDLRKDPSVREPIERERKPYVSIPSGKPMREAVTPSSATRPGGGVGLPLNGHGVSDRPGTTGSGGSGSGGYVSAPYSPISSNPHAHASSLSSRPSGGGVGLGPGLSGSPNYHPPHGTYDSLHAMKLREKELEDQIEKLKRQTGPQTPQSLPAQTNHYPSPPMSGYTPISPHGHYPPEIHPENLFRPPVAPLREGRSRTSSSARRRASSISAAEAAADFFSRESGRDRTHRDYEADRLEYYPGRHAAPHHSSSRHDERYYRGEYDRDPSRIRHHHRPSSGAPGNDFEEEEEGFYRGNTKDEGGLYGGPGRKSRPSSEYGYIRP